MKQFFFMLLLLGVVFAGCNDDVTPPIPVIKEFELTVLDKACLLYTSDAADE